MSDLTFLATICSIYFGTFFLITYLAKVAGDLAIQIRSGVANGTAMSVGQRHALLFELWVPYQLGGFSLCAFASLAELKLARLATDPDMRLLAYLVALFCLGGAVTFLFNGLFGIRKYRRFLQRVDHD